MNKDNNKDKVDLAYNLEIERKQKENPSINEYDFVVRQHEWLSSDEQKIKTKEIEEKTKKRR